MASGSALNSVSGSLSLSGSRSSGCACLQVTNLSRVPPAIGSRRSSTRSRSNRTTRRGLPSVFSCIALSRFGLIIHFWLANLEILWLESD